MFLDFWVCDDCPKSAHLFRGGFRCLCDNNGFSLLEHYSSPKALKSKVKAIKNWER
jgi:hypothetical protein